MAIKLSNVTSGYNLSVINNNFQKLEDYINDKLLARADTGVAGEAKMARDLDMDGNDILNAKVAGIPLSEIAEATANVSTALRNGGFGYVTVDSFQDGATLHYWNEVLRWKLPDGNGEYYRWDGEFPVGGKVVPPGSTPLTAGGEGKGKWISVGDAALRSDLGIPVYTVESVQQMLALTPNNGQYVQATSFHLGLGYGGGLFKYDPTVDISLHNGGTILSTHVAFPTSWTDETQKLAWFYPTGTGLGAWVRQNGNIHDILNYGAIRDGSMLINHILNRMADNNVASYVPRGKYKLENFVRNIPVGGNINMTSMILYGDATYGGTDQTYSWDTVSVIQGSGDLFTDVVNTAIRDIYFRNTPGSTLGKLFTLGAYAQCEFANCVFGPANYHIYNPGFGFTGYNVKPYYRNCRFYGAEIWSRYFEGTVAQYHEQDCYTSHNKRGLYLSAPVSSSITDCIFEYNDDGAIKIDGYGYTSAEYQLNIKNTFFETNGAGPVGDYKTVSDPHIEIVSVRDGGGVQPDVSAAPIRFQLEGNSFVDVTDKTPAYGAVFIDSKSTYVTSINNRIEPAISAFAQKLFTASKAFYVDPVGYYGDSKTSIVNLGRDIRTQRIISGNSTMFVQNANGNYLQMGGYGFNTTFNTVATSGSVGLTLTTTGGAVANGYVLVILSGAGGFATYRYRVSGTSSVKDFVLVDSKESGGFTGAVTTFGHPTSFVVSVQNNGPTSNVGIAFTGLIQ